MPKQYELSVTDDTGENLHLFEGREFARSIMSFIQVADERDDIMAVTIELSDGAIAVFTPVGKSND
jgi:hypothetical protein